MLPIPNVYAAAYFAGCIVIAGAVVCALLALAVYLARGK